MSLINIRLLVPLSFIILYFNSLNSQVLFHQDIFYGGVTGDGFNPFNSNNEGTLEIYIEPGSTIRRALLFTLLSKTEYTPKLTEIKTIYFDGHPIELNPQDILLDSTLNVKPGLVASNEVLVSDVMQFINPSQLIYSLVPVQNQEVTGINGVYCNFYLYVEYENPSMSKINSVIYLNDKDASQSLTYPFSEYNKMNLSNDVSFTFNGIAFCGPWTDPDGSFLYIEELYIGLIFGEESWDEPMCTGVRGAFYYQNDALYGLDNDTPDAFMDGTDALANIQSYLTDPFSFNFRYDYQSPSSGGSQTNTINEFFLTYTTPCDTFSVSTPNDTTVCYGSQLQLNVTGGTSTGPTPAYEWSSPKGVPGNPAPGLSCWDCPNPVFTADSSMFYTVRIWNNDSCSVVRPLKINVEKPVLSLSEVNPTDCGTTNGSVELSHNAGSGATVYLLQGSDTIPSGTSPDNLAEGMYTFILQSAIGCHSETLSVEVEDINQTIALFDLFPSSGEAPLKVKISPLSINATNYTWLINGEYLGNVLPANPYTFENGGTYTLELQAWQYDPECADTFSRTVEVWQVIIPTAFTPDNDGVNDTWEILQLNDFFPENTVRIFNRWGELLYIKENGSYPKEPWNGTFNGEALPVGSYYYSIEPNDGKTETLTGTVSVIRE